MTTPNNSGRNAIASIKHAIATFLGNLKPNTEYHVTWKGAESVIALLENGNFSRLITCLPICTDKVHKLLEICPAKSTLLYFAKYYSKLVVFNRQEYLRAYAMDSGYNNLTEVITKETAQREAHEYSFDNIAYVDEKGHIEKETIPAFSTLVAYPTNIPHTYYVEHKYAESPEKFSEIKRAALITDEFLLNACVPDVTAFWSTELNITGPSINISWNFPDIKHLSDINDTRFVEWFKQAAIQLIAIFKFGLSEAVRAFAPGVQHVIDNFQKLLPYIDEEVAIDAVKSLSEFLREVYQSISDIGGFPNTENYKKPADYVLRELALLLNDYGIVVRDTENASKLYKDFKEDLEIRKDLLKEFSKIPIH